MTVRHPAGTVVDALLDSAERTPDRLAFHVIERSEDEFPLSYADVYHLVAQTVSGLTAQGIGAADRVIVVLPTSRDFLAVYLGCLYAGVVPLAAAEPTGAGMSHYTAHLRRLVEHAQAKRVVTAAELADSLAASLPVPVTTPSALRHTPLPLDSPRAKPASLAHLQATSGSTGTPKLAMIRHGNIVANVRAIAEAILGRADDTLVSWLPLFHDMGLIGISYALHARIPMVLSDPVNFLRNPMSWLRWISRHRGTLSPAPSSAFHICARVARRRPPKDLDLSTWRVALCGAEPVHESTMREFQTAFGPFGLHETTLRPVYGLAEATLAVTISDVTRPYTVDHVDTEAVVARGYAEPRQAADARTTGMMCVGPVLPGHALRVVGPDRTPLPDRTIGEIEVSGPSVIDGYLPEPGDTTTATAEDQLKRADGHLRTGDLGYQIDGELHVTGRSKDIVIISGRNYIPDQLERFVETVTGSPRTSAVVAVGVRDETLHTEQLHLLLDERLAEGRDRQDVTGQVSRALSEAFGIGGVTFHWVPRAQLPRTTSGKIQRHLCRKMIEDTGGRTQRAAEPLSRRA
ncbi:AMP-binding protein [Streptomyces camelliae]|uniref:AMP-binding protein n=1 Tax=Streptomyces camelliae TaxID=3004093 RepID=A0ABY7PIM9_9ACTN|nr:AMP-binding protein [Streptomyces sp. HUAS 2-6]WBO69642.1 AMP-binding protein [Streptomyces sp. HUAS 2-6]